MSFLQPWLLAALPLVALPIIIHLINQRRFQTIHWAAMMFLLAAQRMARGYSRLRQWLILLFRTLVVAGLVLAVSRPLASGWLGLIAAGEPDTTIVLLDRSPSMQQQAAGSGESKLEAARAQLARTLAMLGSKRWVLIDSATREARDFESPEDLSKAAVAGPASAAADVPLMLQAAHDYIKTHRAGRTDVWICSDLRASDWAADSGRWKALRDAFLVFPQGVRFQLLAYPQPPESNVALRVTNVRRQVTKEGAELLVSFRLTRMGGVEKREIPLQLEIEGSRSVLNVEMTGAETDVRDHRIPIEALVQRGHGRASIPADTNAADNECFFVFDDPPPRRTLIVSENPEAARPLELAAGIAPEDSLQCSVETVSVEQLPAVEWNQISLVLWQAALPTDEPAELLKVFVDRGGQAVFFPPRDPSAAECFGVRWEEWNDETKASIETWRGDADLLARTQSGAALPVGELQIHRYCRLGGEVTGLAMLSGGAPLLARVLTDRGGVYFCSTTPSSQDSTLATNGVVLYAAIQRALHAGSAVLGRAQWLEAGTAGKHPGTWQRISGGAEALSTEAHCHAGVYSAGERLLAVNRPLAEDETRVLSDQVVTGLFGKLDFTRVDDQAGSGSSLIQEVWRIFLAVMLVALLLEALLCLPKLARSAPSQVLPAMRAA